ncbi:MAG: transposase, partial [Rhodobacteraceae bacterium]|nr:transposase [Paracoccaceae bacterium]
MAIIEPTLFSWKDVEARSDLDRFYLVRDHLPDEEIVQALEANRDKGRDDLPVRAMWNSVISGVVFQHPSIESLIRGQKRNPALLDACGFNPLPAQKKPVPELVRDAAGGPVRIAWPAGEEPHYAVPNS